ncbi:MAG: ThuA domain-containing protein [Armatimonadota bacterium]
MNRRDLLGAVTAAAGAGLVGAQQASAQGPIRVLCWSEMTEPKGVYPKGINGALADYLNKQPGIQAKVAALQDADQGVSDSVLAQTDVLAWFGHQKHGEVRDERVNAIVDRMKNHGLGFLALHSSHYSKVLKKALNSSGDLGGVGDGGQETVYVVNPAHPIAKGITDFALPEEEFYDEPFGIPEPDALVFFSVFSKGGKNGILPRFRSGACFEVGKGRLFYFRPGHETFPTWYHPSVQQIIANSCHWAARRTG